MLTVLLVIIFSLIGGWTSRMCGGAPPKLPWGLDQWIYAIPYFAICAPAGTAFIAAIFADRDFDRKPRLKIYEGLFLLLPYSLAFTGKRTGHGGGMDLGHNNKEPGAGREPERLEFLIAPLHGKIAQYWYDALLLAVTGLAVTLVAGLIVCFVNVTAGLLIIVSGPLKALAYMIGWAVYPDGSGSGIPYLDEATAIGEFLTGVFNYAALAIAFYLVFGG